jgi:hypothetical protein
MSKASVDRIQRESSELAAQRQLLGDVALGTILDPDLHRSVVSRPHCVQAISRQVLFLVTLAAKLKASSLQAMGSAKPKRVSDISEGSASTPLQTQVVIFGLGGVGTQVVETLLASKRFHPTSIVVVTRQARFPTAFANAGIRCFNDATSCLKDADVLLFCCQPGQYSAVAKTVRDMGTLKPSCIAMSVCAGLSADKAAAQLGHVSCMAADIDVSLITRNAHDWHVEDAALARQRRLEFAAQKSVSGVTGVVAADPSLGAESEATRHHRRQRCAVEASFFADGCGFVQRAVHTLAASVVARGLGCPVGLRLALSAVLGVSEPVVDDRARDLVEASRISAVEQAVGVTGPDALIKLARETFENLTRM